MTNKFYTLDGKLIGTGYFYEYENFTGIYINQYKKTWYYNGKTHRENGPASVWHIGHKEWCSNGKLHRLDGPAVECTDGSKVWWVDGKRITEQEHKLLYDLLRLKGLL